jgi:hypothetical protein
MPHGFISKFFEPCDPPKLAPRFDPPPDVTDKFAGGDVARLWRPGHRPPF